MKFMNVIYKLLRTTNAKLNLPSITPISVNSLYAQKYNGYALYSM
jgi:hypothetical protein